MGRVPVDLTITNLVPVGTYTMTVKELKYQGSTAEKAGEPGKWSWSSGNFETVDFTTFAQIPDERRRLHYTISVPGRGNIFKDLYMGESSRGFLQDFMKACGVQYDKSGFDPEEAVGKQFIAEVGVKEGKSGTENTFKFSKV